MVNISQQLLSCMLLLWIGTCSADNDPRVIKYEDLMASGDRFSEPEVGYFSLMLFDLIRDQVVVGARDFLYRLNLKNLQKLEKATWLSAPDKIKTCLDKGQSETDCHNYIKVLLPYGKKLFSCGTNAFSPLCTWRELEDIGKVSETVTGLGKCPYNPHANVTSLMTVNGQYFSGTPMDFLGTDVSIIRDFGRSFLRTNQYNSKWLNEAQFVGSFETDAFIYFLFRESAVEYINCGKRIYSRIARVCKNDNGGQMMLKDNWTTFLKARLNCSIPGEYPFYFDEIQGVTYLPDEGLVYATFTTPRNSIEGSAICSFNLTAINSAFNGPFKHQVTVGSAWERYSSEHPNQGQCHNLERQHLVDSSKYQLMDNAVQPVTQFPLYNSQLETLVHITVDVISTKLHRVVHVIYVSTEDSVIKKLSILPRTQKTCVLEIWKPHSFEPISILSINHFKQTDSLYIGTDANVLKIPSQHCKRHKTKQACLNAMDPYCGWNELKEQCLPPPDNNPLASYWQQSITSCPTFTHPVNGGWSAWSAWEQCIHLIAGSDSTDYCVCSKRQCDNPQPQNGGTSCEGISMKVENCTVHGGWTNWSAWSACSESCGMAIKTRKRTCTNPAPAFGGRVCVGQDTQEQYCHENPPCPEIAPPSRDGGWSAWGSWSDCSSKCGGGYRIRTRQCNNPPPQKPSGLDCQGCNVDYELCNTVPCSDNRKLSNWTPWVAAENGTQKRFRFYCKAPISDSAAIKITLAKEEERICQADGTCFRSDRVDPDDAWSDWSPWSSCSIECGGGIQYRTRNCESRAEDCAGPSRMTKTCNTHSCKGEWGCWTDWSNCSGICGASGVRQRTRVCISVYNRLSEGIGCEGPSVMQEPCEMLSCEDGWEPWSDWSICDESGQQFRTRNCIKPCRYNNDKQVRICNGEEVSNEITPIAVQSRQSSSNVSSTSAIFVFCMLAFITGIILTAGSCYYWIKKHQQKLPASPHYISKQNPYVTIPLRDVPHSAKRTPSFSKTTLVNGTPKIFTKPASADYETATIKRNSHSLLNGQGRTSNLEQDKFF